MASSSRFRFVFRGLATIIVCAISMYSLLPHHGKRTKNINMASDSIINLERFPPRLPQRTSRGKRRIYPLKVGRRHIFEYPTYSGSIPDLLRRIAIRYHIDVNKFLYVAHRESGFSPTAYNPPPGGCKDHGCGGLFQMDMSYWPARARRYGFAGASVFDAVANATVAAKMIASGCPGGCWGPWGG